MTIENSLLQKPFEIHFSELPVIEVELLASKQPAKFTEISGIHKGQGTAFGVTFRCENRDSKQLIACILKEHDEVMPPWLEMIDEQSLDINYGADYKVELKKKEVVWGVVEIDAEELGISGTGDAGIFYIFDGQEPEYLILDCDGQRIRVSPEGQPISEDGENVGDQPIFDPEEFDDCDDFDTYELWEVESEWLQAILKDNYGKDTGLTLSRKSK